VATLVANQSPHNNKMEVHNPMMTPRLETPLHYWTAETEEHNLKAMIGRQSGAMQVR
jgi:hypothetical protein